MQIKNSAWRHDIRYNNAQQDGAATLSMTLKNATLSVTDFNTGTLSVTNKPIMPIVVAPGIMGSALVLNAVASKHYSAVGHFVSLTFLSTLAKKSMWGEELGGGGAKVNGWKFI